MYHIIVFSLEFNCNGENAILARFVYSSTSIDSEKEANNINFGKEGLIGADGNALYLEFDLGKSFSICGTRTDYNKNSYTVKIGDEEVATATGNHVFEQQIEADMIKVEWEKTNGTAGIHFEFIGFNKTNQGKSYERK